MNNGGFFPKVKAASAFSWLPDKKYSDLHLHSPLHLYVVMLNYLSIRTNLMQGETNVRDTQTLNGQ
jgi:hypothetical protein